MSKAGKPTSPPRSARLGVRLRPELMGHLFAIATRRGVSVSRLVEHTMEVLVEQELRVRDEFGVKQLE